MTVFLHNEFFFIALTLGVFLGAQKLQRRLGLIVFNPILMSIAFIILILHVAKISYSAYEEGGRYIAFMLKPAIVALGVPLYQQMEQIKKQAIPIFVSMFAASIVGIVSAVLIAYALGASPEVFVSISPKSATTPIAMEVSQVLGGIPALTAVIVILTGIFGAVFGFGFLRLIRVRSCMAQGLAMGAAAHAVGTAQAMQKSPRLAAYSGLGLILNGTLTGLLAPLLVPVLTRFLSL